jgi:hypothetical protein
MRSPRAQAGARRRGARCRRGQASTEFIATLLLTLASFLSAWSLFQSAKWSGRQSLTLAAAAASRVNSSRFYTRAEQQGSLHVDVFLSWLQAVEAEEGPANVMEHGWTPTPGKLSTFMFRRFPSDLRDATAAWLARRPFRDPGAPATPFDMPEYRREDLDRAEALNARAAQLVDDAQRFNLRSDRYVALNVILTLVLFFAGLAPKVDDLGARRIMLVLGVVALLSVGVLISTYPVALG